MNLTRLTFQDLCNFFSRRRAASELCLQVLNITRETVLARFVKVADTAARRRKGLLGRQQLSPGEGLWILPCESVHTICMRFPIDIVYLDRNHRVKKIRSDLFPWRLSACFSACSVIELASGTIRETQTQCGDLLEFSPAVQLSDKADTYSAYEIPQKADPSGSALFK